MYINSRFMMYVMHMYVYVPAFDDECYTCKQDSRTNSLKKKRIRENYIMYVMLYTYVCTENPPREEHSTPTAVGIASADTR